MTAYPYYQKTTIHRLPTRRQAGDDHDLYMGYNFCTSCGSCDGTGFVIEVRPGVYLPVFGDEDHLQIHGMPLTCCPDCNPHHITPRDTCCFCANRSSEGYLTRGNKWAGQRMSWRNDRMIVFNGYLCDQCAQTVEDDGGTLH